jgi:SLT domain-containing protein
VGDGTKQIVQAAQASLDDFQSMIQNANKIATIKVSSNFDLFDNENEVRWGGQKGNYTIYYQGLAYKNIIANSKQEAAKMVEQLTGMDLPGYAYGGIINSDGLYRAGEFGKKEGIIPLENKQSLGVIADAISGRMSGMSTDTLSKVMTAMGMQNAGVQVKAKSDSTDVLGSVVGAIGDRIASFGNAVANAVTGGSQQDSRPILYVENLIADDNGLRELNRRMQVIQAKENARRGLAYGK